MARPSNRQTRREEIANSMLSLLGERGFDGASIGAIAKHAGLAPGLVHYHFSNKEEILEAAVSSLVAAHDERVRGELESEDSPADYLDRFLALHLELRDGAADPNLSVWQSVLAEAVRRPNVAKILTGSEEIWKARLSERFAELGHPAPESSAVGLLAVVRGYFALAATSPSLIPSGSAINLTRTLLGALIREGGHAT